MNEIENTNTVDTGVEETTDKTYTQAEVDELLQKEADRRVSMALKKQEVKNQEKMKEAEKLAAMNEAEKFQYQLEQRERAIAEKEKALALAENKNVASKILADKGLSLELVGFVVAEDAEAMDANIKALDRAFKASVKAEIEKRLGSNTPKRNLGITDTMTKDTFNRMSLNEQQRFLNENPDFINTLKS